MPCVSGYHHASTQVGRVQSKNIPAARKGAIGRTVATDRSANAQSRFKGDAAFAKPLTRVDIHTGVLNFLIGVAPNQSILKDLLRRAKRTVGCVFRRDRCYRLAGDDEFFAAGLFRGLELSDKSRSRTFAA